MQTNDSNLPAFPSFPCTSRYVALGAIEDAVSRVSRAIDGREAAALVIGPPGTGKSLLCSLINDQYQSTHQVVVLGETPLDDRDAVLRNLMHRLGVDVAQSPTGDPHLALVDYINEQAEHEGLILIVDEAQKLSAEVIEAIRMVTNITRGGQPRITALLCGGVKLDETLVDSSLESFTQRAATRCYLHPMNGDETRTYIRETIRSCGADPDATITDEAIAAIHHACSGVPRLINQLVSQAIDCAADANQTLIGEQFVDQAWAELQQLPSPMLDEAELATESAPIVFGELSDSIEFGADTEVGAGNELRADNEMRADNVQWSDGPAVSGDQTSEPITADPFISSDASDGVSPLVTPSPGFETEFGAECENRSSQGSCGQPSDDHDIRLEPASAVWVDEPVIEPSAASAQPATAHEVLGPQQAHGATGQQGNALFGSFDHEEEISVGSGFTVQQRLSPTAPADLESLLQQEIVNVGASTPSSQSSLADDSDRAVIQMSAAKDESRRDDSDLLVIEDEVAVIPIDRVDSAVEDVPAVSVDFEAMLTKMRGNH